MNHRHPSDRARIEGFNEGLKRRGKTLQETTTREAIEVLLESMDR